MRFLVIYDQALIGNYSLSSVMFTPTNLLKLTLMEFLFDLSQFSYLMQTIKITL